MRTTALSIVALLLALFCVLLVNVWNQVSFQSKLLSSCVEANGEPPDTDDSKSVQDQDQEEEEDSSSFALASESPDVEEPTAAGEAAEAAAAAKTSTMTDGRGVPAMTGKGLVLHEPSTIPRTFKVDPFFQDIYNQIDNDDDEKRCERYKFKLGSPQKRRIFFGALVADETDKLVRLHATEAYNVYHTVALVESNTTFQETPRTMRFVKGGEVHDLVHSGIFGSDTNVFVDTWYEKNVLKGFPRQGLHRFSIMDRWIHEGMQPEDVGIIGDLDEVFTRDFLRAIQVCEKIHPNWEDDVCENPKLVGQTVMYEGMPNCIAQKRWFHPDMVLGKCLDGIGDPTGRITPVRQHKRTRGDRTAPYANPKFIKNLTSDLVKFPLWSTQDFRNTIGPLPAMKHLEYWGNAFHFHNFFDSLNSTRHKYRTYGQALKIPEDKPFGQILPELDLQVRCVHSIPDSASWWEQPRKRDLLALEYGKPIPVYFRNETYFQERIAEVTRMIIEDEVNYGSSYDLNNYTEETIEKQAEEQRQEFEKSRKMYKPNA